MRPPIYRSLLTQTGVILSPKCKLWLTGHELLELPLGTIIYHINGNPKIVDHTGFGLVSADLDLYTTYYVLEEQIKPLNKQVVDSADF